MKEFNLPSKIFAFISLLIGSLWIGAYLTRTFVTYQLFQGPDLAFKSFVTDSNLSGILLMLLPAVTSTFVLYTLFILFFVLFVITSKIKMRDNGWFFIITIMIVICLPFEIYLMTLDYPLIVKLNSGSFSTQEVIQLIIKRFKILGSFPIIEIFCFMSFYYFILFKPLRKKIVINEN